MPRTIIFTAGILRGEADASLAARDAAPPSLDAQVPEPHRPRRLSDLERRSRPTRSRSSATRPALVGGASWPRRARVSQPACCRAARPRSRPLVTRRSTAALPREPDEAGRRARRDGSTTRARRHAEAAGRGRREVTAARPQDVTHDRRRRRPRGASIHASARRPVRSRAADDRRPRRARPRGIERRRTRRCVLERLADDDTSAPGRRSRCRASVAAAVTDPSARSGVRRERRGATLDGVGERCERRVARRPGAARRRAIRDRLRTASRRRATPPRLR